MLQQWCPSAQSTVGLWYGFQQGICGRDMVPGHSQAVTGAGAGGLGIWGGTRLSDQPAGSDRRMRRGGTGALTQCQVEIQR